MRETLVPTATYPAIVGAVLADLRKEKGLNQSELATRVGINQSAWSKVERGASALTIEQLAEVGEQLGTPPGEILDRADRIADYVKRRGIQVENKRISGTEVLAAGAVVLGVAALGALIALALSSED